MRRHVGGREGGRGEEGVVVMAVEVGRTVQECVYRRRLGGIVPVPEFNHARRR